MNPAQEIKQPKVRTVLNAVLPVAHLPVDAAIVTCIDPRLWNSTKDDTPSLVSVFQGGQGWKNIVPLTEAGGIKILATEDPSDDERKEVLLRRIVQELDLHHPPKVVLSVHTDCGAYGYAAAFGNDAKREKNRLYADLVKAKEVVLGRIGDRALVSLYVFGVNGVVEEIFFS